MFIILGGCVYNSEVSRMPSREARGEKIRSFLLGNVTEHPKDIVSFTAREFHLTRPAVLRHSHRLIKDGQIGAEGRTRDRTYKLLPILERSFAYAVSPALQEDVVWRDDVHPLLRDLPDNAVRICEYGLTEMLQNVVDHSEATSAWVHITRTHVSVKLEVSDNGVGIFNKVQRAFNLPDPRDSILELAKGKLTTDPERHSGEGVFFTSRVFDEFTMMSGNLFFSHSKPVGKLEDWLLEGNGKAVDGTYIAMSISTRTTRTLHQVLDQFTTEDGEFGFTKTVIPVKLARVGDENLVSRSQAKRLLARFERFSEIILDFRGVSTIGQAFADEVFRVYARGHPTVHIFWINTRKQVREMIARAQAIEQ
jgi:anti-sigma regulatory factor (Ser/Thr protein kinase)